MKIIVPMAGMGKRMRPHTLTVPKPLIPIAGKPIVQRLVEEIAKVSNDKIDEIAFIIGDFGKEVENTLCDIAENLGAKASIYYQTEALGTAHAIHCAAPSLSDKVVVAFADTLFKADFVLDADADSVIWVQKVEDPSAFGVVKLGEDSKITDFVEKPQEFVSDLAIIGIYYFKDGENLKNELQYLLDNKVVVNGEYQLTDALENMKNKGLVFKPGQVIEWMDCGNKDATVHTNQRILEYHKDDELVCSSAYHENSIIIPPCYIGENVKIVNSVVGPHVSVGSGSTVSNTLVRNSIIQRNSNLEHLNLDNSMVGNHVDIQGDVSELNVGDFASFSK
ncbi:NTP transferase domain-containing protein [Marinifilum sp. N1E240]|uniref:sugar phosphate nucleotidyltransferase n=1 Tax=Marinifilum sp. N1E240 TaxID=2608082 RepID=UPI00128BD1F2|nr:sugar phosphate nucleotidyltransferase [Marinifilum sp. N1E240]MPQ48509.1 NTP transferase domain-containing protein [Marinifilum sp. N1E240]